jgi:crossover junction endodeoxyribonuclease RusA
MSVDGEPVDLDDHPPVGLVDLVAIDILGTPAPQGSKRARPIFRGPRSQQEFTGRVAVMEQLNKTVTAWRQDVRSAAEQHAGHFPAHVPLRVTIHFSMPRPASAPKRRRTWPSGSRNDIDKLCRSTLDALTSSAVFADDGQIIDLHAVKDYAGFGEGPSHPGARIVITRIS